MAFRLCAVRCHPSPGKDRNEDEETASEAERDLTVLPQIQSDTVADKLNGLSGDERYQNLY